MTLIVWHIGMKKMKEIPETLNWIIDHFSLIFVRLNLVLPHMASSLQNSPSQISDRVHVCYLLLAVWEN